MSDQTTNQKSMRDRVGTKNYDEYVEALVDAERYIKVALGETNTVKARRALDEASARIATARWKLQHAMSGFTR